MTVEDIRKKKIEYGYSYKKLAELAHLPLGTVQKILSGVTKAPRYDTLVALERVFAESDRRPEAASLAGMIEEAIPAYGPEMSDGQFFLPAGTDKKQGEFTVEDYYNLPDDVRVELIDGVFFYMNSPNYIHQIIAGMIHARFLNFVMENGGDCEPLISPLDVQLDCDNRTMVEPDVLILCDRSKFKDGIVFGAPDLVVEILSRSTRKKDTGIKYYKYHNAGVREYWIIYPGERKAVVYDFENEAPPAIYGEHDSVPVSIYGGKCTVDLQQIFARIDRITGA
ncbi:MAG: Uma2 family endonuclease [Lachnospiraceae bacterium]|nr:Uma2 family endonuclease [Lachnospiraceae bacterium]